MSTNPITRRSHPIPPATPGRGRRTLIGAIGTLVVAGGLLAAAALSAGPDPQRVASGGAPSMAVEPSATEAAAPVAGTLEPIPGREPVSGHGGGIVGFLSEADLKTTMATGEPAIVLGTSKVAFRGLRVDDGAGRQVGWFLSGDLGFVSTAEVANPKRLAEIEATWQRDQADHQRDVEALGPVPEVPTDGG